MATEKERLDLLKQIEEIESKITEKGYLHHQTQKKYSGLKGRLDLKDFPPSDRS